MTETFLLASFCGFLLTPFISIAELIKIQLQNDINKIHRNIFDCTKSIINNGQLYRGMFITAMRVTPGWGIYLLVYDTFNRYFDEMAVLGNNETLQSTKITIRVLFGGLLSGWSAWIISFPFDFIKTQIQSHSLRSSPPNISDICIYTIKKFGFIRGFYRGLTPVLMRSVPVCASHFWVYESVLQIIQNI